MKMFERCVIRAGESLQNCPYLAVWSLDSVVEVTQSCPLLDMVVHERSLSRALPHTCPPPEQFYNPNTYNFGKYTHTYHNVLLYITSHLSVKI